MSSASSRPHIVSIATFISLILLLSISYQATRLPALTFSEHLIHDTKAHEPLPPLKTAVIFEGRKSANLVPLILHFSSVLGPEWPIKVFHTAENRDAFSISPAFQRQTSSGHISLEQLPSNVTLTNQPAISRFFTQPWLYHRLAPAKHILFFQTDSILCANSPRMVEDFLEYDFVGAPIDSKFGSGMNGGLSLRNRERVLEVLGRSNFTGDPRDAEFEDQWFFREMKNLPPGPNGQPGANLPSPEIAARFSVETMWHRQPFGLHQISRWQPNHLKEVEAWCPEYRLAGRPAFA
ncbi:MAG: hypothetical protein LQ348_001705 [Seirophora lacunosa]|nr:MAG: hypothetical protein LQ348_001705 [Seirophora lacunosa]